MGDAEKRDRHLAWRRQDRRPRGYRPGPFAAIYAGLLAAGLAAAAVVYLVLVHDVPGMAANRADTLKTALLVIGGSGALAGLYVAYRKQRTDEANHLRDQDKLFTERYTAAVAQLGSDKAAVRLGGVYALARIADDSERDRPTCLKVLCAYLRMPYDPDEQQTDPAERQVRTTAQTAISDRLRPDHPGFWLDAEIDLTGANLIDLNFKGITAGSFGARGATFSGHAAFSEAMFSGQARFSKATFSGEARFDKATFGGDAWFDEATFGAYAWFRGATFGGDAGFGEAKFGGGAIFAGAKFSWTAWFGEATFGGDAGFGAAEFGGEARFSQATFSGDAWFDGAIFGGEARFSEATFSGDAEFDEATFGGDAGFDKASFRREHPPVWPDGFAEPDGIVWDPPDPTHQPATAP